jgi:hypothetical protein
MMNAAQLGWRQAGNQAVQLGHRIRGHVLSAGTSARGSRIAS